MRESRTYGFVRGAPSNGRPYRDLDARANACRQPAPPYTVEHGVPDPSKDPIPSNAGITSSGNGSSK